MATFPSIYKEFISQKVFTIEEVKAAFPKSTASSLYVQISNLVKRGYIGKVKRGIYYVIPPDADQVSYSPDALLIASKLTSDSKLIYSGAVLALKIYHNFPHVIRITGAKRARELSWGEFKIEFHQVPASDLGFEQVTIFDVPIIVARKERVIIDGLFRPKFVGGFEEYLRIMDKIETIDPEEVVEYVFAYGRAGLVQKVGLILEINRDKWNVSGKLLKMLARQKTAYPIPLDTSSKSRRLVSRWNLWVSGRFLERVKE